jgi:hypothetical protein
MILEAGQIPRISRVSGLHTGSFTADRRERGIHAIAAQETFGDPGHSVLQTAVTAPAQDSTR